MSYVIYLGIDALASILSSAQYHFGQASEYQSESTAVCRATFVVGGCKLQILPRAMLTSPWNEPSSNKHENTKGIVRES